MYAVCSDPQSDVSALFCTVKVTPPHYNRTLLLLMESCGELTCVQLLSGVTLNLAVSGAVLEMPGVYDRIASYNIYVSDTLNSYRLSDHTTMNKYNDASPSACQLQQILAYKESSTERRSLCTIPTLFIVPCF